MKTTTNKGKDQKNQQNCEKVSKHLNHNLFSENFIYDPLDVFSKPMGAIIIRIMRRDFKRNQNYKTPIFLKL